MLKGVQFIKRKIGDYDCEQGPNLILIADKPLTRDQDEIFDSPQGRDYLEKCFSGKYRALNTHVTYVQDDSGHSFSRETLFNILKVYKSRETLDFTKLLFAFVGNKSLAALVDEYRSTYDKHPETFYVNLKTSNLHIYSPDLGRDTFKIPFVILPDIEDEWDNDNVNEFFIPKKKEEKSPYCTTQEMIDRLNDIYDLYEKNEIECFKFDAKVNLIEKRLEYFTVYDRYNDFELTYCPRDEITANEPRELKVQCFNVLEKVLINVPVYGRHIEKTINLFKFKDLIKLIDADQIVYAPKERRKFEITGSSSGEPSKWYKKWQQEAFIPKIMGKIDNKEAKREGYFLKERYEWVYDIEVFKNDWLFVAKTLDGKNKVVCWNDPDNLREWLRDKILIGFNNAAYDDVVIRFAVMRDYIEGGAETVKEYSDDLILRDRSPAFPKYKADAPEPPAFLSWDISFHLPFDIRRNSLKKLTMSVLNKRNYDSAVPFDIDRSLTRAEREEVEKYCELDVDNTLQLFLPDPADVEAAKENPEHKFREFARDSYDIKWNLIVEYAMTAKTLSTKSASFAGKVLCSEKAKPNPNNTWKEVNGKKEYYHIPDLAYKELAGTPLLDFYIKNQTNPDYITEKFEYYMGGNDEGHMYQFGFGGLHQALLNYGSKDLVNMDVASLYPSLLIQYDLMSRGAAANPDSYKEVYKTRIEAKHTGKTLLNLGLKLILNSAIGAMLSKFNPLFDTWSNSTICTYGQLFLFILAKRLHEAGFKIIQSNTDGIMIERLQNIDYMPICEKWMEDTKLVLEFDEIAVLQQNNVNNYTTVFANGKIKSKGFYLSNEKFGKATSKILCNMVMEKPFLEGVEPRDFVIYKRHGIGEIYDGITRTKLDGRSLAFVAGHETDPRTQSYYSRSKNEREVVVKGQNGKPLLDENGKEIKEIVNTESKITGFTEHMLLVDDVNELMMDEIDTNVYINFARNLLNAESIFGPYYDENYQKSEVPAYLQSLNAFRDNLDLYPTSAGVYNQNLLFECDYLTKEEQEALIEPIKDKLYRVVWSGNRSYHIVVRLSRPVKVKEYKILWYHLMNRLNLTGADEQCNIANRYTRVPDQINPKTGELQTLYYEPKYVWDVDELLEDTPRLKAQIVKVSKFAGKNVTKEALQRHINRQDWTEGNRFTAVQKLSPVLLSTVTLDEAIKMIPCPLDKNHIYVLRSKLYYFEKNKDSLIQDEGEVEV